MARSHGKIHADIWRDPDFRSLTAAAQRLFFVLLSQPKLTLVGSLDLTVSKWAKLAADTSTGAVEDAMDELGRHGYVVVDKDVDELVIRSFTKHDIDPARFNSNLAKGLWGAWRGLVSDDLRRSVVMEIPADLWEKVVKYAPEDALICRDLTVKANRTFGLVNGTSGSDDRSEPLVREA